MTERMKPPARRTGGRTLVGAKKTTPPPPPPAAELTPEQFAAERAADQGDVRPVANESQVAPAPFAVPFEASARDRTDVVPEAAEPSTQPSVEVTRSGPLPGPDASQLDVSTRGTRMDSAGEPMETQVPHVLPAPEPAAHAVRPTQPTEPVPQHAPAAVPGAAPAAEVALRPVAPPASGVNGFPVRTDVPRVHQEQDAQSQAAPSEGPPWAQGSGRPKDIPETAVVLNQRIIARESLDSSVPAALKLKKRLKRFALDNELDHLPIGDIVSVALDEWLTARGF
ncbi:hypothetical protein [Streptomyces stelliscabiei]|uniref:hypothetical protein n=1 Tax=Streptomyces stelliscabiei TaxID=146820 RepID=UPI0029B98B72|nr:hypothetical protein [Streptomyces stelliscabiei]MDX2661050.1 hypothetical protein [Streptomyces stelliscabiei]MDX2715917.1 hypothetical protein [Streptomyces stelliscabiei]MDX2790027.1 hypothetical protein [Streptomyces stelliscabiei]